MSKKLFLGAICFFICNHAIALSPKKVTEWLEDVYVYEKELESRHIDLYHTMEKQEFKQRLSSLRLKLPDLNEYQVIVELMSLTRKIGNGLSDGHTAIPLWERDYHLFPFDVVIIDSQVLVVGVTDRHKEILGHVLKSINGVTIEEIIPKFSEIAPFVENSYSERIRVGHKLLTAELLLAFGFVDSLKSATFVFEKKNIHKTIKAFSVPIDKFMPNLVYKINYKDLTSFDRVSEQSDALWFASLDQGKTIYIYFRRYPSMKAMQTFAQTALEYLNKYQSKNLIIDFRDSFGGNGFVGLKLAEYLVQADSINWKDGVYTLIGNKTFSAAMNNSIQFRQLLNAKLVGQPSGARPSGYQDMGQFHLPNSNLLVTYSKRLFDFPDKDAPALVPDILVPLYISDYLHGKDRALEWVFKAIKSSKTE